MQSNKKAITFDKYIDEQMHRFDFANGMSICEGSDNYAPKYTLKSIINSASNVNEFIQKVDEAIVAKLHFDIDTTDKANLYNYWLNKSPKAIDENLDYHLTKDTVITTTKNFANVNAFEKNKCFVLESQSIDSINSLIDSIASLSANAGKALKHSLTDYDGKFAVSIAI